MEPLRYEYEIFDNLIMGELNPFNNPDIDQKRIAPYMLETVGKCENIIIGKFKKERNKYKLQEKTELTNAHPLACKYFSQIQIPSNQLADARISEDILRELDISMDKIIKIAVTQTDVHKIITVGVESDWSDINQSRINYCYINNVLEKEVVQIMRNIKMNLFPLADEQIERFVKRSQHLLLNHATQIAINNSLKAKDTQLKIKPDYDEKDSMILAHSYIVDLISFLEREYKQYLDEDLQIPYQSDLLKKNAFIQKAKTIVKLLKKLNIDVELIKIINEPLCKVLNLTNENRITYHEFKYYQIFLTGLERELVINKNIDQDEVIRFLFQVEFNPIKLTTFIVNQLIKTLGKFKNDKPKMLFLMERQKCIQQITKISQEKYKKSNRALDHSVLNWITGEIRYLKKKSTTENEPTKTSAETFTDQEKLVANSNVGTLALFSKLMYQADIVKADGIQDLCRLISEHFRTEKTHVLSTKNLKNNMYEPTKKNIAEVKTKLIQMINILNAKDD
jgi:hypothetical protein